MGKTLKDIAEPTTLLVLTGVALIGAAVFRATADSRRQKVMSPRRVMAVGDSLTEQGGYCTRLEQLLPPGSSVLCQGFAGYGAAQISKMMDTTAFPLMSDVVVLAGVNDLASGRGVQHTINALEGIYQKARAAGSRVIAVELTPWGGYPSARDHEWETIELNAWIHKSPSVEVVVDTSALGPSGYLQPAYDAGDGLHLSGAGQARLGELIYEQAFGG